MHRLFFDQLGPWGVWAEDAGRPAGFLLGLVSAREPDLAYVHMHAVDPALRGRGVGRRLYGDFAARAHQAGCTRIRALVAPAREASLAFHRALGFDGPLEPGYLGPGQDRWVMERALPFQ
jgi:ribosomal protein S18 acetylase RimI-like enzyme